MANEKQTVTSEAKKPASKLKIDISKVVASVRGGFGKDKSSAAMISTGSSLSKPSKDSDFIIWKGKDGQPSPFEALTGLKGLPVGRICMIAGKTDSAKSTHGLVFMSLAQQQGYVVVLIDSEGKFAKERFEKYFGGNADELLITTSKMILESGHHMESMVHAIMEQNKDQKILIVIDSIGGLLPRNEGEDSLGESKGMMQASRENAQLMRAVVRLIDKYKNKEKNEEMIACLLINQTYSSPTVMGQISAGGAKLSYHSSLIIQLSRRSDIIKVKNGIKVKCGIQIKAKVSKNHISTQETTVSELPMIVTAGGIELLSEGKLKVGKSESGDEEFELEESTEE